VWFPGFVAILTLLVAWFPDGRLHRRWVRVPVAAAALGVVAFVCATAPMAWRLRGPILFTTDTVDDGSWLGAVANTGIVLVLAGAVGCVAAALGRLRRSEGRERQQLLWFATGAGLCVTAVLVGSSRWSVAPVMELLALPLVPASIGVALLRHRLYDIEFVLNRVLMYAAVTVVIGALYVGVLAVTTTWLGVGSVAAAIAASGVVAVGFDRVRRATERVADRFLLGSRHDPAHAMSELNRRLTAAGPEVLDAIAGSIVAAVRLRGARIELQGPDGGPLVGAAGDMTDPSSTLPLTFGDRPVGSLTVSEDPGARLDAGAWSLLADLAAQAAIAARAVLLAVEVHQARARLLEAVEQERRRLRRDLHDGLGTSLVGVVMQLEALGNLLEGTSGGATLAKTIESEVRQLVAETRRLVQGLAPPVIEEVGLIEAIRQHADRLNRTGGRRGTFAVRADIDGRPPLPAAVEVAAYMIAAEAMTNSARHARASRCTVTVTQDAQLNVEVTDDGIGVSTIPSVGVGVRSMRERTEQLGGAFSIERSDPHGTRVLAVLPLEIV
jgi:signal transduction histidine kinase